MDVPTQLNRIESLVLAAPEPLRRALAQLDPVVLRDYWLLGYAPDVSPELTRGAGRYGARIDDGFETSLIVDHQTKSSLPPASITIGPLAVLLLRAPLDPQLTGFMAAVLAAMAAAEISIVPIGAASRDHLLVPQGRVDDALEVLARLRKAAER